jgi:hypothetical protein
MKASCALHTGQYFIVIFCGNNEELVGLVEQGVDILIYILCVRPRWG